MKLWIFWVTLLYLAGHLGHCDIGFGQANDVDDEPVRMQPVVPPPFKNDVKLEMTTANGEEPILVGQAEQVEHTNVVEMLEFTTVGNDGVADSSMLSEDGNGTQITVGNEASVDTVEEESLLQAPPSVSAPTFVGMDGSVESTHNQPISPADVSPESTPSNSKMNSMPIHTSTPEYDPAEVEGELKSFDDELSMVGAFTTEALLDQLDAAEAQIATLTARNAALDTSLTAATTAAAAASQEALELRFQVSALTTSLGSLTEELNAKANVTSEQHEQLHTQHAQELHAAQEKIIACERNATTLAIRARLEKNEKNIARLSVENCRLTLESSSHLQLDERQELEAQIVALKKQLSEARCSPASAAPSLSSSVASARKPPVSNVERVGISPGASESECDASQCLDRLLSKYVFFWAPEHQESKHSSASSRSSTASSSPAADFSDATADSAASAHIVASATAAIGSAPTGSKTMRSDAHLDHIGDADQATDSNVLLAVQVLQRAGSSACTLYLHHVHPLVYTLLKSEFMVVAALAKGVYDGVGLLWHAALSPFFYHTVLPTLQNVYYTQLMPFVHSTLYPWYRLNFEHTVNTTIDRASKYYTEHYEEPIGYYILDPCEFLMGRLYYLQYFLMKFVQSEDLGEQMEQIGVYLANFVPSVITQLCSIPALQSHFGDSCVLVVSSVVYGTVALGVYLCRRVVLGVIAFVLVLLLSPLLVGVYLCAKVLGTLRPRKKTKRAAGNAPRNSSHSSNNSGGSGSRGVKGSTGRREGMSGSNVNSHAPLHSQPPQVSTKLPLNAAIASVAPTSHAIGSNNTAGQLQPPPIVGNAAYSGQMYSQRSSGGNSSVSGPPPGAYAYSNSTSSGPPVRQTQRRSGSDESLNNHGAPPTGNGTSNMGDTWLGV